MSGPSSRGRDLDEDDVRVRPGRRSRPRTKDRPTHEDATIGVVVTVDRGRSTCRVDGHEVMAMKARELGRRSVVVGDRVALVGDVSGTPDTLARIVRVEPRTSTLRRTADDTDPFERVIVANADQLVIVTALADPEPRPRLIDRCLVAAYDAGLRPLLCLTKSDLAPPETLIEPTARSTSTMSSSTASSRWTSCASTCATASACSWVTPASGSRRWSTRWSPAPAGRPAASTR